VAEFDRWRLYDWTCDVVDGGQSVGITSGKHSADHDQSYASSTDSQVWNGRFLRNSDGG